jgi:hypothetical protein
VADKMMGRQNDGVLLDWATLSGFLQEFRFKVTNRDLEKTPSQFSFEGFVENGRKEGVEFGCGFGLQALERVHLMTLNSTFHFWAYSGRHPSSAPIQHASSQAT